MYSQNNKTGVLEVLEIKIFSFAQPWSADLYNFFENFVHGFYNMVVESL